MISRKQLKVLEVFIKKPFQEFSRKQIKKGSNVKSNNLLALAINSLKREKVLLERHIGRSGLLTLNMDTSLTFYYMGIINDERLDQKVKAELAKLRKEISIVTPFYSIVLFGSYADKSQKKSSDIDIAILVEGKKKEMEAASNAAKLKTLANLDIYIISREEFIEMLVNKEENLGKQLARKHMVLDNSHIFYDLVREGMNHGFRI